MDKEKIVIDDTTKKYARWALVILLVVGALLAVFFGVGEDQGIAATSMAVQVPAALNTAIAVGIAALLTLGFTWVFNVFGLDLRGQAPVLALAISAFVSAELQNIINIIPAQFDPFVSALLYLLVLVLAPAGVLYAIKKKDSPPHQLI